MLFLLYFPEKFSGIIVESETIENMNDDDDMILENDDDIGKTLNERGNIDIDEYMSDTEDLDQTTSEDIILTHILGQKSNGVITRSRSIRHQNDLYADFIEATTYNETDTSY